MEAWWQSSHSGSLKSGACGGCAAGKAKSPQTSLYGHQKVDLQTRKYQDLGYTSEHFPIVFNNSSYFSFKIAFTVMLAVSLHKCVF